MDIKQNKPAKLRKEKTAEELTQNIAALRKELSGLRVSKVSSGVASKLAKIKVRLPPFSFWAFACRSSVIRM